MSQYAANFFEVILECCVIRRDVNGNVWVEVRRLANKFESLFETVRDAMSDVSIAETHGQVVTSFAYGDHKSIAYAFIGDIPKPRRIVAIGDSGVNGDD